MHSSKKSGNAPTSGNGDLVVLCDELGNAIGTADKLRAHTPPGRLHRAFSVFVFHPDGRLVLQQRASDKYHFPGRWTNTCCSHPRPGEGIVAGGRRRLREEMGLDIPLREAGAFLYHAEDSERGLVEHEFDWVLVGLSEASPVPDPGEAAGWRYVEVERVREELRARPEAFTPWFEPALKIATGVR